MRLGLRAFERLPFPRRFSRLDGPARQRFLERLERSRLGPLTELLMLAKLLYNVGYAGRPEVRAVVGDRIECDGTPPDPVFGTAGRLTASGDAGPASESRGPVGDTSVPAAPEPITTTSHSSAAALLAESGLDVVVLEAGGAYDRRNYPEEVTEAIQALYRDGGLTIAEGRPAVPIPVGRALGGTTVINSGTCFRAPAERLQRWRSVHGIGWATELADEYAEAEEFLAVTRLDPERMGRNGILAMEGAARIGASGGPISRNAGRCSQCSSCPVGCRADAKRGAHLTYLPRAVAAGARIRTGVEATRLTFEGRRCTGVECVVREPGSEHLPRQVASRPYRVRARRVILAGGALGTPELLLRSAVGTGSAGNSGDRMVGNRAVGGQAVGRGLHVHPACWIGARYPEPVRGWEGVMQSYYIDQWHEQGLLLEATFTPLAFGGAWLPGVGAAHQRALAEFDRVASIGVHLSDRSAGRVQLAGDGVRLSYRLERADADRLVYGIARAAEIHFAAGAEEVYPNIARAGVLRPGDLTGFEQLKVKGSELRLEAFHPMGTARIGPDRRGGGVCAPDGSVHGTDGLYVADASLFPESVGVNPMMTVIAFARRIARDLRAAA